ncbi:hypothetical protein CRV24_009879 [Beauveria bassiana]|nr:hypothetical protein CRV24_009879 [Beauveria bassiana]KAH8708170.1 hypothetical protein HC256_010318 [Beauveria bassiana]
MWTNASTLTFTQTKRTLRTRTTSALHSWPRLTTRRQTRAELSRALRTTFENESEPGTLLSCAYNTCQTLARRATGSFILQLLNSSRPLAVQGQPLPFSVTRDAVVAAKFYDPLYNDHILIDAWKSVDYSYRNEAQAYQRLRPLQGVVVPRFYGSYTVDMPVPQAALQHHHAQPRPVRLVLYEYINGTQLSSAEGRLYSTKQRQAIMQKVLNSFSKMRQLGVYHLDFHPGNIVVLSAEQGQEADIRCIDFGHSKLSDPSDLKPTLDPESRESVTEYWRDEDLCDCMLDFSPLIDWPWNEWLENEYVGPKAGARL